ncbi:type II toxin-antitoxin system RelE/ParE family toxin [Pseudomonas sp. SZMC_28357]|uniref:type II toxin-antitoxin system RelE/ParE family toxin n=1 Tax=Pseudomonas sp. SZMC_28357 TaxID=3074380 RepID=UPI00287230D1|nr:type II toxin-antitoxin system RelE/ParE family toxin [Pseudomonas sp. SZMC_28357]MDR9755111.1 type II toxin-antitoxin system RelE/ParE family toxin [Pseudomonas sp. SZMC_28357]
MPSVVLTEKADSDLDAIHEHYQRVAGNAKAIEVVATILHGFQQLERFPGSGRPSAIADLRELVLVDIPFIAPYRYKDGQVQILRILHQRIERSHHW